MRAVLTFIVASLPCLVHGATSEVQRVIDSCGGVSSNGNYVLIDAVGQGQPIGYSFSDAHLSTAGFLQHDANESAVGLDQDGDSFTDWTELSGIQFSPNTPTDPRLADSDEDGTSDKDEVRTGTDPMDAGSCLRVVSIEPSGNDQTVKVKWMGRQGFQYSLLEGTNVANFATTAIAATNVVGGTGAGEWLATVCQTALDSERTNAFYRVRLDE